MGLLRFHEGSPGYSSGPDVRNRYRDTGIANSLNLLPQPLWIVRAGDGVPEFFNKAWCDLTGATVEEGIAQGWLRWISPDDQERLRDHWGATYRSGILSEISCRMVLPSGEARWHKLQGRAERDSRGAPVRWILTATDIHAETLRLEALEQSSRLQKDMLDASIDCIQIIDTDGNLTHMNRSGCRALMGDEHYAGSFGMPWLDLLPPTVRNRGQRALAIAHRGKNARFGSMSVLPGCKPQHWDNLLSPLTDAQGNTTSILCVSREVTLHRETEHRLRIASETDALTGLLNRRAFTHKLKRMISKSRQMGRQIGLMLTDLDHFKHLNDTLGHQAGDHLLRVLSARLRASMGETDIVARLGGDEFAIAVDGIENEVQLLARAQQLLAQISGPITYAGHELSTSMSIGCAIMPGDAADLSTLLKCADTALNDLKAGGRGGVRPYTARMKAAAGRVADQLERARQLVRERAVHPCYEPRLRLTDGTITSFQARLRWQNNAGDLLLSDALETAFTDYELATNLSRIMYDKILTDMVRCRDAGRALMPVTFRARMVEFLRDELADDLLQRLHRFNVSPSLIELEITEQALSERGSELVVKSLGKLKDAGVRTMLGNFGTGQSSLIRLGHYPVDAVKMDHSLISRLTFDAKFQAIVQAITTLAPGLSLGIVAEGIATEEQRQLLVRLGCTLGQGPLFGEPMLAGGMMETLAKT